MHNQRGYNMCVSLVYWQTYILNWKSSHKIAKWHRQYLVQMNKRQELVTKLDLQSCIRSAQLQWYQQQTQHSWDFLQTETRKYSWWFIHISGNRLITDRHLKIRLRLPTDWHLTSRKTLYRRIHPEIQIVDEATRNHSHDFLLTEIWQ